MPLLDKLFQCCFMLMQGNMISLDLIEGELTLQLPLPDLYCDEGIGRHDELTAMIKL